MFSIDDDCPKSGLSMNFTGSAKLGWLKRIEGLQAQLHRGAVARTELAAQRHVHLRHAEARDGIAPQ